MRKKGQQPIASQTALERVGLPENIGGAVASRCPTTAAGSTASGWKSPTEFFCDVKRPDPVAFATTMQLSSRGAQPPGRGSARPRAERTRVRKHQTLGEFHAAGWGRAGASHGARGGRAPQANCMISLDCPANLCRFSEKSRAAAPFAAEIRKERRDRNPMAGLASAAGSGIIRIVARAGFRRSRQTAPGGAGSFRPFNLASLAQW